MHQGAEFARRVGMAGSGDEHHFWMVAQAGLHLVVALQISGEEELQRRLAVANEHQRVGRESGERVGLAGPIVGINDVFHALHASFGRWQVASAIDIVGLELSLSAFAVRAHGYHHRQMVAADVSGLTGGAALRSQIVKFWAGRCRDFRMSAAGLRDIGGEFVGYGNFLFRRFAQRHA